MTLEAIQSRSLSKKDLEPRVYMLTGINGVGKTTLADQLAAELPNTAAIHASQELRNLFGGISREQQERMKLEDRLAEMVMHFTVLFDRGLNDNDNIIFDTQLLIPTSGEQGVYYESAWSDEYTKYLGQATMLTAHPRDIRTWRERDEKLTGRKRSLSEEDIEQHQNMNMHEFTDLLDRGAIPANSQIIKSEDGQLEKAKLAVIEGMTL